MLLRFPACLLPALAATSALAQAPARPDPLDAAAPVAPPAYTSPFAGPRAAEARVGSWLAANERAVRAGGWRAYAREASRPEPAASAPASQGHHGHGSAAR